MLYLIMHVDNVVSCKPLPPQATCMSKGSCSCLNAQDTMHLFDIAATLWKNIAHEHVESVRGNRASDCHSHCWHSRTRRLYMSKGVEI